MYLIEQITDDKYLVTLTKKEYEHLRNPKPKVRESGFLQTLSAKDVIEYCKFIWDLPVDIKVETTEVFNLVQHLKEASSIKWRTDLNSSSYTYSYPTYYPVQMKKIMVDYGRQWLLAGYCEELNTLLYYYSESNLTSLLPWKSHVKF